MAVEFLSPLLSPGNVGVSLTVYSNWLKQKKGPLLVGHQGEPQSALSRGVPEELGSRVGDVVPRASGAPGRSFLPHQLRGRSREGS